MVHSVTYVKDHRSSKMDSASTQVLKEMQSTTPARIGVGRAGVRPRTSTWLAFRRDHALARDAVNSEFSEAFLNSLKEKTVLPIQIIQSNACSRQDYVLFPPKGKRTSQLVIDRLIADCPRECDVQIVISDGLSARAVETNIPELLPILHDGLELEQISAGVPIVVRFGRVAIGDQIGAALSTKLVINLIGERPGLSSSTSLSAYMTYNPGTHTISSDRTVVSNIHEYGTPPIEAGAYIVKLAKVILTHQLSGVRLQELA